MKQQMKQALNMSMTPQLQQAIKILQMSSLELQTEVTQALVENPVLEEVSEDGSDATGASLESLGQESSAEARDDGHDPVQLPDKLTEGRDDFDWQSYVEQSTSGPVLSSRQLNHDELPSFEQILAKPTSLYDHLMWQLRMAIPDQEKDARALAIGEEIIGNLNDDGYLVALVEEIASGLKVTVDEVSSVLNLIQNFDPPGVGARNLQECLLLQAEALEETEEIEELIKKHLTALENKNYGAISKAMNLPLNHIIELCKVVHDMDPRPGRAYSSEDPVYITPDVYVMKVGGRYSVVLNEENLPRLRLSKAYQEQILDKALKGPTKQYLKEKLKDAAWLIRSIHQRQRSIFRVAEAIVGRQQEFFEKGTQFLRPCILKDIADELALHESTVSRVTTNKWMHTPHGIFELKFFFSSAVSRDGQDEMASESVRQKIKQYVSTEDPRKPLSDQDLCDLLKDQRILVARRTVAKYREALGILPSNKRKKYF